MLDRVCVDANIVLKLVLPEEDSHLARALWRHWMSSGSVVVAPSIYAYEGPSIVRKWVHRGWLTEEEGEEAYRNVLAQPVTVLEPEGLLRRAWEYAHRFDQPQVYDSTYLALADLLGCEFWTADERLHSVVQAELPWVRLLAEFTP